MRATKILDIPIATRGALAEHSALDTARSLAVSLATPVTRKSRACSGSYSKFMTQFVFYK